MATLAKRISLFLATAILGTTLLGSVAYAAVPNTDVTTITAIPADTARTASDDDTRTERDHHRRFCIKLNAVLTRLVEQGVITREQKARILDAFNCPTPTTDRPSTTERRPTTGANATRATTAN